MKQLNRLLAGIVMLLTACSGTIPTSQPTPIWTQTSLAPTGTATVKATDSPTPSSTPLPVPTRTWVIQGPGDVTVPILLYHRIRISPNESRYSVSPEKFEEEIQLLQDWEYTSITIAMLIKAITEGTELPPRPILITFDDGHEDNYTNAFPILQKHGFAGVIYIVGNYLGADGFMDREQILEMHDAGWDVGSHSMNHYDLTKLDQDHVCIEIKASKNKLEHILGIDILTFAYPFGAKNKAAMSCVHEAGYIAAMGAEGYADSQGKWNLYNLQRVEIKSSETVNSFTRFLSWQGPIE